MTFKKLNDEPIAIEYIEDEHDETRDFQPSFWWYNQRYYLNDFTRTHDNPWVGWFGPDYIHGYENDNYINPLFIEVSDDGEAVNVYEEVTR